MAATQEDRPMADTWNARANLSLVKWLAVVLPILFLAAVDIFRQTVFSGQLYPFPGLFGLLFTYAAISVSVLMFSHAVFAFIARLQRKIIEQNRQLSALLAVGRAVSSPFDLEELLSASLDTIIEVTSADTGEIWLIGEGGLVMRSHRGAHPEAFHERTSFPMGEGIPGIVGQTGEPIIVHDLPSEPRFLRQRVARAGFHTFCALPMRYRDRLVGVLIVVALSEESIREPWELRLLEAIGDQVALAIENERLHQQVQDLAVLQERERIAREMHDGLGQVLGYINTQTLAVKKLISNNRIQEATEELTSLEETARDLYADVREGILGLRTSPHKNGGMIPALREYVESYAETSGIDTRLQISPDVEHPGLSPSVEIQLIRIVQEALSNVRRHAGAVAASVEFRRSGSNLEVEVADDGRGFDPAGTRSAGWPRFGLQTMRERAESVGGSFAIESAPGLGTRVIVRIPLGVEQGTRA